MKTKPVCSRCRKPVVMKPGVALVNHYTRGIPDFIGDGYVSTVSLDTKNVSLVKCLKCPQCGHSIKNP